MSDFEIKPGLWTYQEFNQFVKAIRNSDNREAGRLVGKILVSWKLKLPLAGIDPLAKAPMPYAAEIIRSVLPTCEKFIEAVPTDDFVVDLDLWGWEDFNKFQDAGQNWNVDYVENELRRVVKVNGQPIPSEPLDYVTGAVAMRKVASAIKDAFSAKN